MSPEDVAALAAAAAKLKQDPKLVHHPELESFRVYIASAWGVRLDEKGVPVPKAPLQIDLSDDDDEPVKTAPDSHQAGKDEPVAVVQAFDVADSDEEDPGRVPEDSGPYPPLPPERGRSQEAEATEEQAARCAAAKQSAQEALDAGDAGRALERLSEALLTGAASALLFVRRAELLMKLRRPVAAVRDCDAAVEVNADCGKAYRVRGLAYRSIGRWEAAHRDLALGQKLDYDDGLLEVSKLCAEKAKRIEERRAALAAGGTSRKRRRQAK